MGEWLIAVKKYNEKKGGRYPWLVQVILKKLRNESEYNNSYDENGAKQTNKDIKNGAK